MIVPAFVRQILILLSVSLPPLHKDLKRRGWGDVGVADYMTVSGVNYTDL